MELDLANIDNLSVRLDLIILLRTTKTILQSITTKKTIRYIYMLYKKLLILMIIKKVI